MSKILEQVEYYINDKSSNYAVLIDGEWGSGKTFLWKNIISKFIEGKSYHIIYVSLNGISTEEEIDREIFFSSVNKKVNLGEFQEQVDKLKEKAKPILSLAKTICKVTGKFDDIKINYDEIMKLDNCILCFDDLERVNMPFESVLGYINKFVEHDGIKTFIIANEKEIGNRYIKDNIEEKYKVIINLENLKSKSSEKNKENEYSIKDELDFKVEELFKNNNYIRIKEKVIGRTIKYKPNLDDICNGFIKSYENGYKELLNNSLSCIIKEYYSDKLNIRVLNQSLNEFQVIYDVIENKDISTYIRDKDIEDNYDEIKSKLFKFYILFSMEYRLGNLNENIFNKIKTGNYKQSTINFSFYPDRIKEFEKFINNYYYKDECFYIKEAVRLVVQGYINTSDLEKEIMEFINFKYLKVENKKRTPTTYEKLENFRVSDDDEIKDNVKKLKSEFKDDKDITIILKKVALLIYLYEQKVIDIDFCELETEITEIINSKNEMKFFEAIESIIISNENDVSKFYLKIYEIAKKRYEKLISISMVDTFEGNDNDDLEKIIFRINEYIMKNKCKPVLYHIDNNLLAQKVLECDNKVLVQFIDLIKRIYFQFTNIWDYYSEDKDSLKLLHDNIEMDIDSNQYGVRYSNLNLLCYYLDKAYQRLEKRVG